MDKAFLIDVASKLYIATDSSHVEMQALELCSDMIDVVIDISCIYGFATFCTPSRGPAALF
jgi:Ras-related GTP-binding protein C/D